MFKYVPNRLKTQEMCNDAVDECPRLLEYVPDYFVTEEMLENRYIQGLVERRADYSVIKDMLVNKYKNLVKAYMARRDQKREISKKLLPVAWHPDCYWYWCIPHDEKQEISKLWDVVDR